MMRLLAIEHVEHAVQSLRSTKMRSLLTTLGVAIGVASITTILSLSSGVTKVIDNQVQALGGNIAIVQPRARTGSSQNLANPLAQESFNTSTLTEQDLKDITSFEKVQSAAPLMIINGSLQAGNTTLPGSTVVATTPAFADVTNIPVSDGQFIDTVTNKDTAVVGPQLAIDLFGTDQPIGKTFSMQGQTFTVIGVLKRLNDPVNFNNVDLDHAAIISLESGKAFHQGIAQLQQIDVRATSTTALPDVIGQINHKLLENHRNEQDFSIISGKAISQPTSQLFVAVTDVTTAIAAISLIVGGIGIMNIMLVGVAERTREIGLRKSVGASNGNIVGQFMTEALIISMLGGVFGYVGGYLCAFIISNFLTFDPAFTWQIAVAALGISLFVGIVFGFYPALRAARKDPIESLRQYH
jgi:putative ABC transport system permease protein